MTEKNGEIRRGPSGRFGPGNPGKPRGARNRVSKVVLMAISARAEDIADKAVSMALNGDSSALRLCLERLCPPVKDSYIRLRLPRIEGPGDLAGALAAVLKALAQGKVTPAEAQAITSLLTSLGTMYELSDFSERLDALEEAVEKRNA